MNGEKFKEIKKEENQVIRINEFKNFEIDKKQLCEFISNINDHLEDGIYELYEAGICYNNYDELYSVEVDKLIKWLNQKIEVITDEDENLDTRWIMNGIKLIKVAKGFSLFPSEIR